MIYEGDSITQNAKISPWAMSLWDRIWNFVGSIAYVFGTECTIQDIDIKYYGQRNTLLVNSVFTTQLALLMLNVQENQIFW